MYLYTQCQFLQRWEAPAIQLRRWQSREENCVSLNPPQENLNKSSAIVLLLMDVLFHTASSVPLQVNPCRPSLSPFNTFFWPLLTRFNFEADSKSFAHSPTSVGRCSLKTTLMWSACLPFRLDFVKLSSVRIISCRLAEGVFTAPCFPLLFQLSISMIFEFQDELKNT